MLEGFDDGVVPPKDILSYTVTVDESDLIHQMASKAEIGGRSYVRPTSTDRQGSLTEDQLLGQLGAYVFSMLKFGRQDRWLEARHKANANPTLGDGGRDYLHLDLDVKTSLMRYSLNPLAYHMYVQPNEKHDNWIYVQALVKPNIPAKNGEDPKLGPPPYEVYLVGWCETAELVRNPDPPVGEVRYELPVFLLRPLSTLIVPP